MSQNQGDDHPAQYYDEISRLNNELVNAQRELARKNQQLEALNEQLRELLGMIAHDLRNPISSVNMLSQLLARNTTLTGEQPEVVQRILDTSRRMRTLLDRLLDVSRLDAGKLELQFCTCDLVALLRRSLEHQNIFAVQRQLKVRLEGPPDGSVVPAKIDPLRMEQVITNILSNAIRFSPVGSELLVRVRRDQSRAIFSIIDTGPGIPADEMSKLFKPFARVSSSIHSNEPATGLGLAIARRIVEMHYGSISAESVLGKGSAFTVSLPLGDASDIK